VEAELKHAKHFRKIKSSGQKPNFSELGRTGLNRYGGWISEEWLSDLSGTNGVAIYKRMSTNEAIIGGGLFAIEMLCKQVPWWAVPGGGKPKDIRAARFLESNLYDMSIPWPATLSEILTMYPFGWSWLEKVFKVCRGPSNRDPSLRSQYNDGLIRWRKLAPRAQETLSDWEYDEDSDTLQAMVQIPPPDFGERRIPLDKSLLFRMSTAKDNPEGTPGLRRTYRAWFIATNLEDIEAMGMERDLAGYPVLYVPAEIADPDPDDEEAVAAHNDFMDLITGVRRDQTEGLLLSSERDANGNLKYELKLVTSSGTRQIPTNQVIMRWKNAMAVSMMTDFLLLGQGRQGSYALAETKSRLFAQSISAILDSIVEVINSHGVPDLVEFNPSIFEDLDNLPYFAHGKVEIPNLQQLADYLHKLGYKADWLKQDVELENHLRSQADLPIRPAASTGKRLQSQALEDEEEDEGKGEIEVENENEDEDEDEGMEAEA
jgi:hypothetical protein